MLRIGWFSTGRGEGSRGLLQFVQEGLRTEGIDARIEFVFSNRAPGEYERSDEYFRLVRPFELPLVTCSSAQFRRRMGGRFADHRAAYDAEVLELLADRRPDICVLAGYMLIASSGMCRAFPLLNLHPALPDGPIGTWQEVVWQLIERRADRTGVMMHLATEEVDRGPLVTYATVPLRTPELEPYWRGLEGRELRLLQEEFGESLELFRIIRFEQYRREPHLLLETLRAVSRGEIVLNAKAVASEVSIAEGKMYDPDGYGGLCLDSQIEDALRRRA